ncbi:MAG: ferritin-like domain-containing protein [Cyanobacteriota bacterium]|nr:ferritin-like domain-containing protein [Cyanobacteriota bacterium]
MAVSYPRKILNTIGPKEMMAEVVKERKIQILFLNSYRFNEQRSCQELTALMEALDGRPKQLVRELSHHVSDEARHAVWLTDLLCDLGEEIGNPKSGSYIDELNRLLDISVDDGNADSTHREDALIAALASINATEKRGCQAFSAHIAALRQAPQTEENLRIRETLEKILPEEAAHVSWGSRWLGKIASQSPEHRARVQAAKRKYFMIEHAAFEAGMDITAGAELRRLGNLVEIANTLPAWERPAYVLERLPQALLSADLQKSRLFAVKRVWEEKPEKLVEQFIPMFLSGLRNLRPSLATPQGRA